MHSTGTQHLDCDHYRSTSDRQAIETTEYAAERIEALQAELAAWRKVAAAGRKHSDLLAAVEADDRITDCPVCSPWRTGFSLSADETVEANHTCGLTPSERIAHRQRSGNIVSRFDSKNRAATKVETLYREAMALR